ncbi:MAG TPA: metallophosphoesterase [Pyrinomonadaceae bacterium]|nr:metallophosphoesterase [Pyrinomonadaceae bacterium]
MLAQLLQRDFMLKSTGKLAQTLHVQSEEYKLGDHGVHKLMEQHELTVEDLLRAAAEMKKAIREEGKREPEAMDGAAYFPRHPVIGLTQSALQEFCDTRKKKQVVANKARAAGKMQNIAVTNMQMDQNLALFLSGSPPQRALVKKYELLDIRWANCLAAIGLRKLFNRYPFNEQPAKPAQISNRARVVLVGDWGSGLPRAASVGEAIAETLHDPKARSRDKHVIHLGDVYYSGLPREYENNFLKYWPVKKHEANKISSRTLNANHDMYSGGWGYFDYVINGDRRFQSQKDENGKPSSFFSLENDHWLILGLDTGYHENLVFDAHDLYGRQHAWVSEKLNAAPNKGGILLSHHQPFSAFEKGGKKIVKKLKPTLRSGRVRAWFWGHEHRCTLYQPRENIEYPRCIGHGGVPFYVSNKDLPFGVSYEYQDGFRDYLEKWNYFGFAVLDFDETNIRVTYINEKGVPHHAETITKA